MVLFSTCSKSCNRPAPVNCDNLITDTARTNDNAKVFAYTAFTPNSNGLNDVYKVFTTNISTITVTVYDENNTIVFNSPQLSPGGFACGWKPVATNCTYAKYNFRIQATTNSNHKIGMCGNLYLVNCVPTNADRSLFTFEDQLTQTGFTNPTQETLTNTCQ